MPDTTELTVKDWEAAMALLTEIPDEHPPGTASPKTPDSPSGEPSGFQTVVGNPPSGVQKFQTEVPSGDSPADKSPTGKFATRVGNPTSTGTPPGSFAKMNADEDLDHDVPDNLSMDDGSFFVLTVDDLRSKVDAVKTADQVNPVPQFLDVKAHLARRAAELKRSDLIPDDWNATMAMHS